MNLKVLSQVNLYEKSLQGQRPTVPAVKLSHPWFLVFIGQKNPFRITVTIQIYNTLEVVSTVLTQTQLLVTFWEFVFQCSKTDGKTKLCVRSTLTVKNRVPLARLHLATYSKSNTTSYVPKCFYWTKFKFLLLPPGVNPISVNKYININININSRISKTTFPKWMHQY